MELHSSLRIKLFYQSLSQPILQGTIDLDEEEEKEKKALSSSLSPQLLSSLTRAHTHQYVWGRRKQQAPYSRMSIHLFFHPSVHPPVCPSIKRKKKKMRKIEHISLFVQLNPLHSDRIEQDFFPFFRPFFRMELMGANLFNLSSFLRM